MATNIVGQFPVLNKKKSQTDEYGFDYLTYQYTIKTETLDNYIPKKDDVFTGLKSNGYKQISPSGLNEYAVTDVQSSQSNGGLTELTIQTIGTQNEIEFNTPKITIRQGGPLIFGLGTISNSAFGIGIAGVGLDIEIKFLGLGGNLQETTIYNTYIGKLIPSNFRGILTPKGRDPFSWDTRQNGVGQGYQGQYLGYCCKSINTERRGALNLYTLIFKECGTLKLWPASTGGIVTPTIYYNFPLFG